MCFCVAKNQQFEEGRNSSHVLVMFYRGGIQRGSFPSVALHVSIKEEFVVLLFIYEYDLEKKNNDSFFCISDFVIRSKICCCFFLREYWQNLI